MVFSNKIYIRVILFTLIFEVNFFDLAKTQTQYKMENSCIGKKNGGKIKELSNCLNFLLAILHLNVKKNNFDYGRFL